MQTAVVIYDLKARDGRSVIEARYAVEAQDGKVYVSLKSTFYSCAYADQLGRIAAFSRVAAACTAFGCTILTYCCGQKQRACWQ